MLNFFKKYNTIKYSSVNDITFSRRVVDLKENKKEFTILKNDMSLGKRI